MNKLTGERLEEAIAYSKKQVALTWGDRDLLGITQALEELQTLRQKQTPIDVPENADGEYWCPKCSSQIMGYYAAYCEICGQAVHPISCEAAEKEIKNA